VTFESGPSKGVNVLAIFRYVVKIEVFSEGETRKKFSASGFVFERLTFLSKVENRLKRGESLCENFTRGDILNFKKCLDNGNLWFLPFSFQWLLGHTFFNRKSNLNLIIFKTFLECVGKVFFLKKRKPR